LPEKAPEMTIAHKLPLKNYNKFLSALAELKNFVDICTQIKNSK